MKGISMADDLPVLVREAQKSLLSDLKEARSDERDAYIRFPASLVIDGKVVKSVDPLTLKMAHNRRRDHQSSEASYSDVVSGGSGAEPWRFGGGRGQRKESTGRGRGGCGVPY